MNRRSRANLAIGRVQAAPRLVVTPLRSGCPASDADLHLELRRKVRRVGRASGTVETSPRSCAVGIRSPSSLCGRRKGLRQIEAIGDVGTNGVPRVRSTLTTSRRVGSRGFEGLALHDGLTVPNRGRH